MQQTARISDPLSGEMKMEFRGHEHVIEVVVFAPIAAYPAIRELAGIPVKNLLLASPSRVFMLFLEYR